jgi:hypothetical protein
MGSTHSSGFCNRTEAVDQTPLKLGANVMVLKVFFRQKNGEKLPILTKNRVSKLLFKKISYFQRLIKTVKTSRHNIGPWTHFY